MSIVVTSTPNTETAATPIGDLAESKESAEKKESASADKKADETAEKSDASEESEELAAKSDEESEAEKPKKKGGFQKRIDKLTRKNSDLERELEYLKREVHGRSSVKDEAPAKQADTSDIPKEENFDTHAEYLKAVARQEVRDELKQADAKRREESAKKDFQTQVETYAKNEASFKEKHEDFDDVMDDVSDVRLSITVRNVLLSAENGPELAYELAKNRDELERICKMNANDAARAIGKFEATLTKSSPQEIKKTKAPKPIEAVGKSAASAVKKSIYDPGLSQSEFEAIRREDMRKRNAAWG